MNIWQKIFNFFSAFIIISIIIGFFATDFDNYKPQIVTEEMRFEKKYIEKIGVKIQELTDIAMFLKDTNEKAKRNEIVPMKVASNYQSSLNKLEKLYKEVSAMDLNNEVPNRYKVFHNTLTKAIEEIGVAVNEVVAYVSDKQDIHLKNSDEAFNSFYITFDKAIDLYNKLVFERE